jgi:ribosomal protein L14E/L6E/L27E
VIYAKVIIEVNNLQNNDLIGEVVLSKTGRDKDHLYVVIGEIDQDYVLLSNGGTKTVEKPKKKKIKHLNFLNAVDDEIKEAIKNSDKSTDLKIKRFLKLKDIVKEG